MNLPGINLDLPQTPQAFSSDVLLYQEFLRIYNALRTLQEAMQVLVSQASASPIVLEASGDALTFTVLVGGIEKKARLTYEA